MGVFLGPVISDEVGQQQGAQTIGVVLEMTCCYYAISAQRQLKHQAVLAINEAAKNKLFNE
ncbi:MAG: LysR family transcriptional activator of nhaA [Cellvibrionaceae bacterium]